MIPNIEQIKAEYQAADFNRRLHLYLQFPLLRTKFLAIDQREVGDWRFKPTARRRPSLAARLGTLLTTTAVHIKRFMFMALCFSLRRTP